jgi:hypothetical protein
VLRGVVSQLGEDAVDHGLILGGAGTEVPGRGGDGRVPEQRLHLRGVGAALAQPGAEGVPEPLRAQAGDAGADCQDDLDDSRDGEVTALPEPQRAGVSAAVIQPRRDQVSGVLG